MKATLEKAWVSQGFELAVVGTSMGHRCGYLLLDNRHPWVLLDQAEDEARVHWGLTFGSSATSEHLLPEMKRGAGFWIGFDTAHCDDGKDWTLMSQEDVDFERHLDEKISGRREEVKKIWSTNDVAEELESLACQARSAGTWWRRLTARLTVALRRLADRLQAKPK